MAGRAPPLVNQLLRAVCSFNALAVASLEICISQGAVDVPGVPGMCHATPNCDSDLRGGRSAATRVSFIARAIACSSESIHDETLIKTMCWRSAMGGGWSML